MGPALKILKWLGIALGGLVGVLVMSIVVIYFIAGSRLNRTYEVDVTPIAIPTDDASMPEHASLWLIQAKTKAST